MGHCSPALVSEGGLDYLQELEQLADCVITHQMIEASSRAKDGIDAAGVAADKNFHTSFVQALIVPQPAGILS